MAYGDLQSGITSDRESMGVEDLVGTILPCGWRRTSRKMRGKRVSIGDLAPSDSPAITWGHRRKEASPSITISVLRNRLDEAARTFKDGI